jgi:hypothetical protein
MAHFDAPSVVRSLVLGERPSGARVPAQNAVTHPEIA